jgi:hypothetical protein
VNGSHHQDKKVETTKEMENEFIKKTRRKQINNEKHHIKHS